MFEELKKKKKRLEEIQGLLSDPKVISNSVLYQKYAREMSSLKDIVEKYNEYLKVSADVEESESIMNSDEHGADFIELAKEELESLL